MLKNYFKIAIRSLMKNRVYSFINIFGLAMGMALALLIGLWISDELSFDHYHRHHERIAKIMVTATFNGESYTGDEVMMPLGQALRDGYKDLFSKVAVLDNGGSHLMGSEDKQLSVNGIFSQRELPEMFSLKMLYGSVASMDDPATTIISQSLAVSLFGKSDPVGKTVRVDNRADLRIGGVYEDLPDNTSFAGVQTFLPWYNKLNNYRNSNTQWNDHNGLLYVQLADNITPQQASARIKSLPTPHIKNLKEEALAYPLDRAHLYSEFKNGEAAGGRIRFVWLFATIGVFVLLLACINFMNLSTARSEKRAREVGIRKTVGSVKSQLIFQFLGESLLLATLSFFFSLVLVTLSLPFFNGLAAKSLVMPWNQPLFWLSSLAFVLITGILAGSYPAFYLSGFDPVKVLKGSFKAGKWAALPRQILVVLQFTVSLTLIIGTLVVFRQISFTKDRPVGYNRDGLVTVEINTPELEKNFEALRQELQQKGLVESMAASSMKPTDFTSNNGLEWRGKRSDQQAVTFRNVFVTPGFGNTIRWNISQGRDFSYDYGTDTSALILNQAAANLIGIKNPIGETMKFWDKSYTVIGVVDNMVVNSPYDKIAPAIFLGGGWSSQIAMRLKPGAPVHATLEQLGAVYKKYNPASPFLYQFTDQEYARKFESEERTGRLAGVFTGLAILISCLGLFGLASFVAEQRTREIGVRKVLGAGMLRLWALLSREFLALVAISLLIAIPVSYAFMQHWLEGYTYRTGIPAWIFLVSGAGILFIALATVSYQSIRAALMSPVKSLRAQ